MQFTAAEIEKYEMGSLSFEKKVDLFQRIVDSGMLGKALPYCYTPPTFAVKLFKEPLIISHCLSPIVLIEFGSVLRVCRVRVAGVPTFPAVFPLSGILIHARTCAVLCVCWTIVCPICNYCGSRES